MSGCVCRADPFFKLSNRRTAPWQQQQQQSSLTTQCVRRFLPACQRWAVGGRLSFLFSDSLCLVGANTENSNKEQLKPSAGRNQLQVKQSLHGFL